MIIQVDAQAHCLTATNRGMFISQAAIKIRKVLTHSKTCAC